MKTLKNNLKDNNFWTNRSQDEINNIKKIWNWSIVSIFEQMSDWWWTWYNVIAKDIKWWNIILNEKDVNWKNMIIDLKDKWENWLNKYVIWNISNEWYMNSDIIINNKLINLKSLELYFYNWQQKTIENWNIESLIMEIMNYSQENINDIAIIKWFDNKWNSYQLWEKFISELNERKFKKYFWTHFETNMCALENNFVNFWEWDIQNDPFKVIITKLGFDEQTWETFCYCKNEHSSESRVDFKDLTLLVKIAPLRKQFHEILHPKEYNNIEELVKDISFWEFITKERLNKLLNEVEWNYFLKTETLDYLKNLERLSLIQEKNKIRIEKEYWWDKNLYILTVFNEEKNLSSMELQFIWDYETWLLKCIYNIKKDYIYWFEQLIWNEWEENDFTKITYKYILDESWHQKFDILVYDSQEFENKKKKLINIFDLFKKDWVNDFSIVDRDWQRYFYGILNSNYALDSILLDKDWNSIIDDDFIKLEDWQFQSVLIKCL